MPPTRQQTQGATSDRQHTPHLVAATTTGSAPTRPSNGVRAGRPYLADTTEWSPRRSERQAWPEATAGPQHTPAPDRRQLTQPSYRAIPQEGWRVWLQTAPGIVPVGPSGFRSPAGLGLAVQTRAARPPQSQAAAGLAAVLLLTLTHDSARSGQRQRPISRRRAVISTSSS
jgi:hypothetical protein